MYQPGDREICSDDLNSILELRDRLESGQLENNDEFIRQRETEDFNCVSGTNQTSGDLAPGCFVGIGATLNGNDPKYGDTKFLQDPIIAAEDYDPATHGCRVGRAKNESGQGCSVELQICGSFPASVLIIDPDHEFATVDPNNKTCLISAGDGDECCFEIASRAEAVNGDGKTRCVMKFLPPSRGEESEPCKGLLKRCCNYKGKYLSNGSVEVLNGPTVIETFPAGQIQDCSGLGLMDGDPLRIETDDFCNCWFTYLGCCPDRPDVCIYHLCICGVQVKLNLLDGELMDFDLGTACCCFCPGMNPPEKANITGTVAKSGDELTITLTAFCPDGSQSSPVSTTVALPTGSDEPADTEDISITISEGFDCEITGIIGNQAAGPQECEAPDCAPPVECCNCPTPSCFIIRGGTISVPVNPTCNLDGTGNFEIPVGVKPWEVKLAHTHYFNNELTGTAKQEFNIYQACEFVKVVGQFGGNCGVGSCREGWMIIWAVVGDSSSTTNGCGFGVGALMYTQNGEGKPPLVMPGPNGSISVPGSSPGFGDEFEIAEAWGFGGIDNFCNTSFPTTETLVAAFCGFDWEIDVVF